jgi:chaperone required for assembly of F1-ATPase
VQRRRPRGLLVSDPTLPSALAPPPPQVCFRVDAAHADASERLLRKRQDKHYGPVVEWFAAAFATGAPLGCAHGFGDLVHPGAAYVAAEDAVDTASPWAKAALQVRAGPEGGSG